ASSSSNIDMNNTGDKENEAVTFNAYTNQITKFYTLSCLTPDQRRGLFFNVNYSFEVQVQDFNKEWWPLTTNVWTKYNSKSQNNGNLWVVYACRFTKHNQSSSRKEEVPCEKHRKMKVRQPDLCYAKIRVLRFIKEQKFLVERYPDSPDHTHSIEESEKLKHFQLVHSLVEEEAIKNYLSPAIVNAIKEHTTRRLDLSTSVKELKRMKVYKK
ncbi:29906_t:CDS:2, partial [Gigaspora margarita]